MFQRVTTCCNVLYVSTCYNMLYSIHGPFGHGPDPFFYSHAPRGGVSAHQRSSTPSPTPKTCPLTPPTPTSPPTHTTHAHLTAPAHVRALQQARQGHAWAPWAWPRPIFLFARTARWCLCAPAKHHAQPPPKTCPLTPPTPTSPHQRICRSGHLVRQTDLYLTVVFVPGSVTLPLLSSHPWLQQSSKSARALMSAEGPLVRGRFCAG